MDDLFEISSRRVDHYLMVLKNIDHKRFSGKLIADVTIDDLRCDLTINLDNGTVFNHRWNARGFSGTFKNFLIENGNDHHYLLGKVARESVFDATETIRDMKRGVLTARKERDLTKGMARRLWNMIDNKMPNDVLGGSPVYATSVEDFANSIEKYIDGEDDQDAIQNTWDHPGEWPWAMRYPNTIQVFFELMWPRLIDELKTEQS